MSSVLGIDIGKAAFTVHLVTAAAACTREFANNPAGFGKLLEWLANQDPTPARACMEATSTYYVGVATALYEAGHTVFVANPLSVKRYAGSKMKRTKTDRADARVLAAYCVSECKHPWKPRSPEMLALLELARYRGALVAEQVAWRNRSGTALTIEALRANARRTESLRQEIQEATRDIQGYVAAHPALAQACDLLRSIPGIGPVTAPLLLAEMGDPERFGSARQLVAHAGLCPEDHQSADSNPPAHLTRLGSTRLRNALFMPAMVVYREGSFAPEFVNRLLAENRLKMTILAALMRKLLTVAYGVLKSGVPYDRNHNARESAHDRAA